MKKIVFLIVLGMMIFFSGCKKIEKVKLAEVKSSPSLIPYSIISKEVFLPYKASFDVRVDKINGQLPTKKQLGDISKYLRSKEKPHKITFVCFYLPEMVVDTGAWATAHFNPDLEVNIFFPNTFTSDPIKKIQILADRYEDGNISLHFFSYDSKGASSWIGEGVLKLEIKNENNAVIKKWEKKIIRQGASYEIYMGSEIHSVISMDAEYTTEDGKIYTQKNISLERILE